MKKWLLSPILVLTLCSSSPTAFDATDTTTTETIHQDALPKGWRIEEIAKAIHPSAVPENTHVLACNGNDCLVLCLLEEDNGHESWLLAKLRWWTDESSRWEVSMFFIGPEYRLPHRLAFPPRFSPSVLRRFHDFGIDLFSICARLPDPAGLALSGALEGGACVWYFHCFNKRPSSKEICDFMDEIQLDGAICKATWEAVVKEKPTRGFQRKQ